MSVDDQARDLILFVGDQRLIDKLLERYIGEGHLRGHTFLRAFGCDPGKAITERNGVAFAMRSRRPLNFQVCEFVVAWQRDISLHLDET